MPESETSAEIGGVARRATSKTIATLPFSLSAHTSKQPVYFRYDVVTVFGARCSARRLRAALLTEYIATLTDADGNIIKTLLKAL